MAEPRLCAPVLPARAAGRGLRAPAASVEGDGASHRGAFPLTERGLETGWPKNEEVHSVRKPGGNGIKKLRGDAAFFTKTRPEEGDRTFQPWPDPKPLEITHQPLLPPPGAPGEHLSIFYTLAKCRWDTLPLPFIGRCRAETRRRHSNEMSSMAWGERRGKKHGHLFTDSTSICLAPARYRQSREHPCRMGLTIQWGRQANQ